ncbi:hypothetical protein RR48_03492 [Papilio machaon]|uniref:Uncharacterized protein n=1 Tax=Papilio machaon TaxID=76193 RepID=A0A0N1PGS8_PAPMA|nr:hypothetical protein RR48_03492 [Papilio machaon]
MTVKKAARTGGHAVIVSRQKLHSSQQFDIMPVTKSPPLTYNIIVGFNEKDQLQLLTKEDGKDDDKKHKDYNEFINNKYENIAIDDIANCVNIENYPNCEKTLVFYVNKNVNTEAIALRFENEQDFKRIYFTYKYFKMRNRLTKNTNNYSSNDNLFSKKRTTDLIKNRKNSIDDYSYDKTGSEFDLLQTDSDGVTHISVQQKGTSRFDQPLSLIGFKSDLGDTGEIDSIIYTDIDIPTKPERKRFFHRKPKAPSPPLLPKDTPKVLKGEFVRVNVERSPDVIPKDSKQNKIPDILMFRDSKPKRSSPTSALWTASNKLSTGYESDREEWRSSRSQFSTTAFDSLARPTKMAMALTLRKPQRIDPTPQYYRLSSEPKPKLTPLPFRPNNFLQRGAPRLPRPSSEIKRNLSTDHRKYTSLQSLELPKKLSEPKKNDPKKNYSNISNRITGLTNKLRDLGAASNTIGRFKAQSHGDVANLKPVLKNNVQDGTKRSVVRTCSVEPPKKVTFSAFATVQVV